MNNDLSWLHPQLQKDCFLVHSFLHCEMLLMNDCRFPWVILVPKGADLCEIQDMDQAMFLGVFAEVNRVGAILQNLYRPRKINTAALGNIVTQLHIHVIARFENDAAWPKPVWGVGQPVPYTDAEAIIRRIKNAINENI